MADMNYVSPLTSDLTDYYTKSEVDELQQGDAATYATSAEIVAGDNAVKGWVASQGYLTEHQDLTNYATKDYVAAAVEDIETGGVSIEVIDTLPAHPEENVIYLTRKSDSDTDNIYNEWIWVADTESYELIGDTSSGVIPDLSDYATKQWVEAKGYLDSSALTGYATVSDLADFATKDYVDDELANKANTADLAAVATSGDYEDLSNKPTIPSLTGYATEAYVNSAVSGITIPDVSDFIDAEQAQSIAADEVEYKMGTLSTVAVSGSYNDLTDKPTIPAAPDLSSYATKSELSAKVNAADLATVATSGDYDDLSNKPTIPDISNLAAADISFSNPDKYTFYDNPTVQSVLLEVDNNAVRKSRLATVATSGDYNDLANKPSIPSTSGLATETYVDNAVAGISVPANTSDLTNDSGFITSSDLPDTSGFVESSDLATVATTGDYDDLTNKPTIPSLSGYATETWVGNQGYLTQHQDISGKANSADLATVATSGSYNDLSDKPVITAGGITSTGNGTLALLLNILSNSSRITLPSMPTTFEEWEIAFNKGYYIIPQSNITLTGTGYESGGSKGITWYSFSNSSTLDSYIPTQTSTSIINTSSFCIKINDTIAICGFNGNPGYANRALKAALQNGLLTYSNTTSGLTATTIQGAIDELAASSGGASTAAQLSYDNTNTWNDGTDTDTVQEAIDTLWNDVAKLPDGYDLTETYNANTKTLNLSITASSGR